jgi:GNAT superfamily N-acetyltransferase
MSLPQEPRSWQKPGFLVSTDKTLLSIPSINHAFGLDMIYWTQPVPDAILQTIIDNSFCFGLYKIKSITDQNGTDSTDASRHQLRQPFQAKDLIQIGFARVVGDMVTFAYFTDLYVLPEYQGVGVGGWIIDCLAELLDEMPYLRWAMLRTSMEKSRDAYVKRLGMAVLPSGDIKDGPVMMGRKGKVGGP